jgi:hypothetical protein
MGAVQAAPGAMGPDLGERDRQMPLKDRRQRRRGGLVERIFIGSCAVVFVVIAVCAAYFVAKFLS